MLIWAKLPDINEWMDDIATSYGCVRKFLSIHLELTYSVGNKRCIIPIKTSVHSCITLTGIFYFYCTLLAYNENNEDIDKLENYRPPAAISYNELAKSADCVPAGEFMLAQEWTRPHNSVLAYGQPIISM